MINRRACPSDRDASVSRFLMLGESSQFVFPWSMGEPLVSLVPWVFGYVSQLSEIRLGSEDRLFLRSLVVGSVS